MSIRSDISCFLSIPKWDISSSENSVKQATECKHVYLLILVLLW